MTLFLSFLALADETKSEQVVWTSFLRSIENRSKHVHIIILKYCLIFFIVSTSAEELETHPCLLSLSMAVLGWRTDY